MNALQIARYCVKRGISLTVEAGSIRIRGRRSTIDPPLLLLIKIHKPDLSILLSNKSMQRECNLNYLRSGTGTGTLFYPEEKRGCVAKEFYGRPTNGGRAGESADDWPGWDSDPILRRWRLVDGPVYRWREQ